MLGDETTGGNLGGEAPDEGGQRAAVYSLNDQAKKRLGLHLRAMYESMVQQPVPDRFRELIARLDDSAEPNFDS